MNFMQSVDDDCMNLFNLGQSTRMNVAMTMVRSSLSASLGCVPLGVNEFDPSKEFSIMPNPFNDYINIETRNSVEIELRIYDVSGRNMLNRKFTGRVTLDMQSLSKGVYYMELISDEKRTLERIVKM